MKRGQKPDPISVKEARGTLQPCNVIGRVDVIVPDSLPQTPNWLTDAGREVWLDDIGRLLQARMVTELDSAIVGNYCNLQGAINDASRAGGIAPISSYTEVRRLQEMLGLAGAKSRIVTTNASTTTNPFDRFKK